MSNAMDAMSLQEHDLRYHDGNYRGGECMYRKAMEGGDKSDAELAEVNQREAILYFTWKQEATTIEETLKKNFPFISTRNKSYVHVTQADKDGNSKLMIWCKDSVPDDSVDEKTLKNKMKELGYDMSGFAILVQKGGVNRSSGAVTGKKVFAADIRKKVLPKFVEAADLEKDNVVVQHVASPGELDDDAKNRLLRRYGVKSVGGKIVGRDKDDNAADRAKKYLGIVGDWQ